MRKTMETFAYHTPKENQARKEVLQHTIEIIIDGQLIGRAEIDYHSKPFPLYQISELYVELEYQGRGYGNKIMAQIEAFLKKKRKAGVIIDAIATDSPASGMYARRGWQEIPGERCLYAYNLPKNANPQDLRGYAERQTDLMTRPGWEKHFDL